jgi:hypothetical protein
MNDVVREMHEAFDAYFTDGSYRYGLEEKNNARHWFTAGYQARADRLQQQGEAVAWQYRIQHTDSDKKSQWAEWVREDRPETIGRWKVEYRPLFAHPAPSGASVELVLGAGRMVIAATSRDPSDMPEGTYVYQPKQEGE